MSERKSLPTAADVAAAAGVSKTTVSYVFSGRRSGASRITDETRRRVLEAAQRLDYVPNHSARALRKQETERVCLVLPQLGEPLHDVLANDLQAAAAHHGYSIFIAVSNAPHEDSMLMEQLQRRIADGVVIVAEVPVDRTALASLAERGIAVVVVGGHVPAQWEPPLDGVDAILSDTRDAFVEAVRYLVRQGHERIAFMAHRPPNAAGEVSAKFDGFLAGMAECDLTVADELVAYAAPTRADSYRCAERLLSTANPPTAILAASDFAAGSTIWAARDLGLRIPEDIAIIGVGDIPDDVVMRPPLTTLGPHDVPSKQIAELLFSRLADDAPAAGRSRRLRWSLVVRGSA